MTMPRAIALLVLSILVTAGGIFVVVMEVQSGLVNPENPSHSTGAFTGEDAATPPGAAYASRADANPTIKAALQEVTAAAATRSAVLTPFPTESGDRGGAVPIGYTAVVGTSSFTVHQVADPEPQGFFPTRAGNRRVAIELSQTANSGTVRYNFSEFRLRDATGEIHAWTTPNSTPDFKNGTLQAGESRKGWLSFQLPAESVLDALIWQPLGSASAVVIVALR